MYICVILGKIFFSILIFTIAVRFICKKEYIKTKMQRINIEQFISSYIKNKQKTNNDD